MADAHGAFTSEEAQAFYSPEVPDLKPEIRDIFKKYSKIPDDQVEAHIRKCRDEAWAIQKYPCIGQWRFLEFPVGEHKLYPEVVSRMQSGEQVFLDLGCAFAQDIRRLAAEGVDSSKCYGSDLRLDFIGLGYELFNDKQTLKSRFIAADVFDLDSPLHELEGTVDIIGANSFFHLFSWDEQKKVAQRVNRLLKPRKDSLLLGRQIGNKAAGDYSGRGGGGGLRYRHNADSWRRFWKEVGHECGVEFEVDVTTEDLAVLVPKHADGIRMEFSVRRL